MPEKDFIPFIHPFQYTTEKMIEKSAEFYTLIKSRRTVREYSDEEIPFEVIKNCILSAGSAPSGANMQPWHFVVISDKKIKEQIRFAAEKEEKEFYEKRAPKEWLEALKPLGTNEHKPFLEHAPYLIIIFEKKYSLINGKKIKHYYSTESTGIATGILITALHYSGLSTLTHTPSPMNFLTKILNRPEGERAFLLLVVGKAAKNATVPNISRKSFDEIAEIQ